MTLGLERPYSRLAEVEHQGEAFGLYVLPGLGGGSSDEEAEQQGAEAGAPGRSESLGLFLVSLQGLLPGNSSSSSRGGGGVGQQRREPRRPRHPTALRFIILGQSPWGKAQQQVDGGDAGAAGGADGGGGGGSRQPVVAQLSPMVDVTGQVMLEEDEDGCAAGIGDLLNAWLQRPGFCGTRRGAEQFVTIGVQFADDG